ncbi:MAG: hypothetical protein HON04_18135 [Planctomicrobium sp.]|nr:hypothetical protein [Planctomicrobium sp.]
MQTFQPNSLSMAGFIKNDRYLENQIAEDSTSAQAILERCHGVVEV